MSSPATGGGGGTGHRPPPSPSSSPPPSPKLRRARSHSKPLPTSSPIDIHPSHNPHRSPHPNPSPSRQAPLSQSLGRLSKRAAIDEWMRGWAADPPVPPKSERSETLASISSGVTSTDQEQVDLFSTSCPTSSTANSPSATASALTRSAPRTRSGSIPAISDHPSAGQQLRSRAGSTAADKPVNTSVNVSARAAHFNALARAASLNSPAAMPMAMSKAKAKAPRRSEGLAPSFARPTRSSSAKQHAPPLTSSPANPAPGVSIAASTVGSGSSAPTTTTMSASTPSCPATPKSPAKVLAPHPSSPGHNGLRPLLLSAGPPIAPERRSAPSAAAPHGAGMGTMRKRLSLVPYKVDTAPRDEPPLQPLSLNTSPAKTRPKLHHRRHSSLIYKKTTHDSSFRAFPRSSSSGSSDGGLSGDPESFLDSSLELHSEPGRGSFHERRHNKIVKGNLERRESILRSIVRVENRERENREELERRGVVESSASVGLRKLSLQGRPARRRASTPCVSTPSPIMDSPIALHSALNDPIALHTADPVSLSPQLGAEELLSELEPQVTRETDISTAPTSLGLGPSRSSLLRPSSVSTSVATTDEEPRVRFATPDEMRATFRRKVHRETTLAQLTGPPRSRPAVEILDHDHLAAMLSKKEYAATITPATSTTSSVASAASLPRYRRREEDAPAPDYVASAYTGDATAGIDTGSSGFGHGEEEGPGAAETAPGLTRRYMPSSTFCGAGGAELSKLVRDDLENSTYVAAWSGDVDPLDHLLPDPQAGEATGFLETLGRWFCPVDGT